MFHGHVIQKQEKQALSKNIVLQNYTKIMTIFGIIALSSHNCYWIVKCN